MIVTPAAGETGDKEVGRDRWTDRVCRLASLAGKKKAQADPAEDHRRYPKSSSGLQMTATSYGDSVVEF